MTLDDVNVDQKSRKKKKGFKKVPENKLHHAPLSIPHSNLEISRIISTIFLFIKKEQILKSTQISLFYPETSLI